MKLFYSVNSPYARKTRVVAYEKGLADRLEMISVNPLENPPILLAANPLAKIPALVRDDGGALCESPVICEYLDSIGGGHALFPEGRERWDILNRAALADGILDAAVGLVVEGRKPESQRSPQWLARHEAAIRRTLLVMGNLAPDEKAPLNIATINLAVALGYVSFRQPQIEWRNEYRELAAWFERFEQRPSMQETMPQA